MQMTQSEAAQRIAALEDELALVCGPLPDDPHDRTLRICTACKTTDKDCGDNGCCNVCRKAERDGNRWYAAHSACTKATTALGQIRNIVTEHRANVTTGEDAAVADLLDQIVTILDRADRSRA